MKRRQLLRFGVTSLSAYLVSPAGTRAEPAGLPEHGGVSTSFSLGVASADPWPTSIVLWTRAEPDRPMARLGVLLQISERETFDEVIVEERLTALAAEDFTLRVTAEGLRPDRIYYYRFRAPGADSPVGRTRTAPMPDADRHARFALVSCQNYEMGYFTGYRHLAARESEAGETGQLDFILHVGDFIYETQYRMGARPFPELQSREDVEPFHAESLEDYRQIYRTYLSDPDLRAARTRWPFICTWDDHEFTNDSWQGYSTDGTDDKLETERHRAARQAWLEYVPARAAWDGNDLSIYRDMRWGRHTHLIVTDCRSYRSDHALPEKLSGGLFPHPRAILPLEIVNTLDAGRNANNGHPPETLHHGALEFPNVRRESDPGSVLGQNQKEWFKKRLTTTNATWKLCALSIPMLPIRFDFNPLGDTVADQYVMSADGWDGYPSERQELLEYLGRQDVDGFVSLTADFHMHFAGVLTPEGPDETHTVGAGIEFACAGISSASTLDVMTRVTTNLDEDLRRMVRARAITATGSVRDDQAVLNLTLLYGRDMAEKATDANTKVVELSPQQRRNRHLSYLDTGSIGYVVITCDAEALHAAHVTIEPPIHDRMPRTIYVADISVPRWRAPDGPRMSVPVYSGTAPYPFN